MAMLEPWMFAPDPTMQGQVWPSPTQGIPLQAWPPLPMVPPAPAAPADVSAARREPVATPSAVSSPAPAVPLAPAAEPRSRGFGGWLNDNSNMLMMLGAGIAGGSNWGEGISRGLMGAAAGRSADQAQRNQNMTEQALISRGMNPQMAALMARNPDILRAVIPQLFGTRPGTVVNNRLVDPTTGRVIADFSDAALKGPEVKEVEGSGGGKVAMVWDAKRAQYVPLPGVPAGGALKEPDSVRAVRAAGVDPTSPEGKKMLFPRTDTPISAADKKAIFEAEDALPQLQGTLDSLKRAAELNSQTFSGYAAGLRADIGTKLPGGSLFVDEKKAKATAEWMKIMGPEALQQMANTLKGATTDFELRKFIELLGDPATDPDVRLGIINRMRLLAQRKMQIETARVKDLRAGTYFQPGSAPNLSAPAPTGQPGTRFVYDPTSGQLVPAR